MKLKVDKNICIGCGACNAICPDVYEIEDDGLAAVKCEPTKENMEDAMDAKDGCPVSAIIDEDKEEK